MFILRGFLRRFQTVFPATAKANQARCPWSQNVVTIGLLKVVHGRWSCVPLAFRFYFLKRTLTVRMGRQAVAFQTKFAQATEMFVRIAEVFREAPMLVVTDSWFGNNGLHKPLACSTLPHGAVRPTSATNMRSQTCADPAHR